jgi:hypothetical protein
MAARRALTRRLRLTWLSLFLFQHHPFRRNVFAPAFWATTLFAASALPLISSGQFAFVVSRPILVSYAGNFCALTLGYLIWQNYRVLFRELRFAIEPGQIGALRGIRSSAFRYINDDKRSLVIFFVPMLAITLLWVTLTFYDFFPHDDFAFFYFLDPSWYSNSRGKSYRLMALWIAIAGSSAILCAGMWFQIFHWLMFQRLLQLRLVTSPVLIYQGFAKLWASTNVASVGLISLNIFTLILIEFKPHPMQVLVMGIVTLPGVVGLLWPTLGLYRVLMHKKVQRTAELLTAADSAFKSVKGARRVVAYSNVYCNLFVEKNVGNMQAAISFVIASVSLVIGCFQIFGWDAVLREIVLHK